MMLARERERGSEMKNRINREASKQRRKKIKDGKIKGKKEWKK